MLSRFAYSRNGDGPVDERCQVRVNISGITQEEGHVRYQIDVINLQTRQKWQVTHRFSEFLQLRNDLIQFFAKAPTKCPGCVNYEKRIKLFDFPRKRYLTSKSPVVLNARKRSLRAFVSLLASHTFANSPKCPFCSALPFTSVRDFLTAEPEAPLTTSESTSDVSNGTHDTIRESINVKNFTTYIPVPKMKPVNSQGVFVHYGSSKNMMVEHLANNVKSPGSNTSRSTTSTESNSVTENDEASDVSLCSSLSSTTQPPPAPLPTELTQSPHVSQKRMSAKQKEHDKIKRDSSVLDVDTQLSHRESIDDEFGALNMDFLQNVSVTI